MFEKTTLMNFTVKPVRLDEIISLRQKILRPNGTIEGSYTKKDFLFTTFHFGGFDESGKLVSCASFQKEDLDENPNGYQLRFMATDKRVQGKGVGTILLKYAEQAVGREIKNLDYFWCDARVVAIDFYEKNGWETTGEVFLKIIDGEDIPHIKMRKMAKQISMV